MHGQQNFKICPYDVTKTHRGRGGIAPLILDLETR
jgi:hypothetical protein